MAEPEDIPADPPLESEDDGNKADNKNALKEDARLRDENRDWVSVDEVEQSRPKDVAAIAEAEVSRGVGSAEIFAAINRMEAKIDRMDAKMVAKIDNNRKRSINKGKGLGDPLQHLVVEQASDYTGQAVANHPLTKDAIVNMSNADINALQVASHLPVSAFGVAGVALAIRCRLVEQYLCE